VSLDAFDGWCPEILSFNKLVRSTDQVLAATFITGRWLEILVGDGAVLDLCFWILHGAHDIINVLEEFESIGRSRAERGKDRRKGQTFVGETKINGKRTKLISVLSKKGEKNNRGMSHPKTRLFKGLHRSYHKSVTCFDCLIRMRDNISW